MAKNTSRDAGGRRLWPRLLAGALVAVVLLAIFVLPGLLEVERYRGPIEQALREATGWEPELGAIDFSVMRGLVLTVSPATIRAPGGESKIEIGSLQVSADLAPLFRGRLNVKSIELLRPSVELVRPDEGTGWVLPVPPDAAAPAGTQASAPGGGESPQQRPAGRSSAPGGTTPVAEEGGFAVSIEVVEITDGRLRLEDRAASPPVTLGLDDLSGWIHPGDSELNLAGLLADDAGTIEARGFWNETLQVELNDLPTDALAPFLGPDLLVSGGELSGTVDLRLPDEVEGKLSATNLALLAGEEPLDAAELEFKIVADGAAWNLESSTLRSTGISVIGKGKLVPDLELEFRIPEAPIESVTRAARAVFPLPLELEPPGTVGAVISLQLPSGGQLSYSARGEVSAESFAVADFLPRVQGLRSAFALSPSGALEVDLLDGLVAGGPLAGKILIDQVEPMGTLSFEGGLLDAVLGQLLDGFVPGAGETISGPAGLEANLRLNLGAETIELTSLGGNLKLDAREVDMPGWDIEQAIRDRIEEKLGGLGAVAQALGIDVPEKSSEAVAAVSRVFDGLSADVDFDALPWTIRNFRLQTEGIRTRGEGSFDPASGEVSFALVARLDRAKTAELVDRYSALDLLVGDGGRLTLPLDVSGSLTKPRIGVDLGQVAVGKLGGEKPEDAIKGLLKGLLGGKKPGD